MMQTNNTQEQNVNNQHENFKCLWLWNDHCSKQTKQWNDCPLYLSWVIATEKHILFIRKQNPVKKKKVKKLSKSNPYFLKNALLIVNQTKQWPDLILFLLFIFF